MQARCEFEIDISIFADIYALVFCVAVSDSLLCLPGKSRGQAQRPSKISLALLPYIYFYL